MFHSFHIQSQNILISQVSFLLATNCWNFIYLRRKIKSATLYLSIREPRPFIFKVIIGIKVSVILLNLFWILFILSLPQMLPNCHDVSYFALHEFPDGVPHPRSRGREPSTHGLNLWNSESNNPLLFMSCSPQAFYHSDGMLINIANTLLSLIRRDLKCDLGVCS